MLIRPSPCPLPAPGEGVFRCGGCAPTPPEKVSQTLFRQSDIYIYYSILHSGRTMANWLIFVPKYFQ